MWTRGAEDPPEAGDAPSPKTQCVARCVRALFDRWPFQSRKVVAGRTTVGLFDPLRPYLITLIGFGVVPAAITSGPHFKLSFHPLRSTLAWALLVHTIGLLSLYRVMTVVSEFFEVDNLVASWPLFPSVLALAQASNYVLLLTIWFEAHRYKEVAVLASNLQTLLGAWGMPEAGAWPGRGTLRLVRAMVVLLLIYSPASVALWEFWASGTDFPGEVLRYPAHVLAHTLLISVVGGFCLVFYIIRDAAKAMSQRFARDLNRGLSHAEMTSYYSAWLALRNLLEGAVVMPLTLSCCTLLLILINLLCIYNIVNRIMGGAPAFMTLVLVGLSPHLTLMIVAMCVAADAAVTAVGNFKAPLLRMEYLQNPTDTSIREVFREVMSYSPGSVCIAGFWYMNRRTATSVLCITLTYLVVLVEFRNDPESYADLLSCNRTLHKDCRKSQ